MVILLSSGPLIPGGDHGPRHGGYAISAYEALTWRVRTRSARRSSQGSPLGSAARQPHYERPRAVLLPFSFVGARLQLPQLVRGCNTSPLARQCFAVATLALGPEPEVGRRAANRTVNGAFDLLRPLRSGEADIRRPSLRGSEAAPRVQHKKMPSVPTQQWSAVFALGGHSPDSRQHQLKRASVSVKLNRYLDKP